MSKQCLGPRGNEVLNDPQVRRRSFGWHVVDVVTTFLEEFLNSPKNNSHPAIRFTIRDLESASIADVDTYMKMLECFENKIFFYICTKFQNNHSTKPNLYKIYEVPNMVTTIKNFRTIRPNSYIVSISSDMYDSIFPLQSDANFSYHLFHAGEFSSLANTSKVLAASYDKNIKNNFNTSISSHRVLYTGSETSKFCIKLDIDTGHYLDGCNILFLQLHRCKMTPVAGYYKTVCAVSEHNTDEPFSFEYHDTTSLSGYVERITLNCSDFLTKLQEHHSNMMAMFEKYNNIGQIIQKLCNKLSPISAETSVPAAEQQHMTVLSAVPSISAPTERRDNDVPEQDNLPIPSASMSMANVAAPDAPINIIPSEPSQDFTQNEPTPVPAQSAESPPGLDMTGVNLNFPETPRKSDESDINLGAPSQYRPTQLFETRPPALITPPAELPVSTPLSAQQGAMVPSRPTEEPVPFDVAHVVTPSVELSAMDYIKSTAAHLQTVAKRADAHPAMYSAELNGTRALLIVQDGEMQINSKFMEEFLATMSGKLEKYPIDQRDDIYYFLEKTLNGAVNKSLLDLVLHNLKNPNAGRITGQEWQRLAKQKKSQNNADLNPGNYPGL